MVVVIAEYIAVADVVVVLAVVVLVAITSYYPSTIDFILRATIL